MTEGRQAFWTETLGLHARFDKAFDLKRLLVLAHDRLVGDASKHQIAKDSQGRRGAQLPVEASTGVPVNSSALRHPAGAQGVHQRSHRWRRPNLRPSWATLARRNGRSLLKSTKPSLPFKGARERGRTISSLVIINPNRPLASKRRFRINGLDAEGEGEFKKEEAEVLNPPGSSSFHNRNDDSLSPP